MMILSGRSWRKAAIRILMDLECPLLGEERKSLPTFKMAAFDPKRKWPTAPIRGYSKQIQGPIKVQG